MHSPTKPDRQAAATKADHEAFDSELSILRDVFRLLPTGVTVQDERGETTVSSHCAAAPARGRGAVVAGVRRAVIAVRIAGIMAVP